MKKIIKKEDKCFLEFPSEMLYERVRENTVSVQKVWEVWRFKGGECIRRERSVSLIVTGLYFKADTSAIIALSIYFLYWTWVNLYHPLNQHCNLVCQFFTGRCTYFERQKARSPSVKWSRPQIPVSRYKTKTRTSPPLYNSQSTLVNHWEVISLRFFIEKEAILVQE